MTFIKRKRSIFYFPTIRLLISSLISIILLPTIVVYGNVNSEARTGVDLRERPLSGVKIVIDPGHGLYYKDGNWLYQRPYCWGIVEDELTCEIASYLYDFLQDHTGAEVFCTRELDKNAGNGISGQPRWKEGAWCHLRDAMGYAGAGSSSQDLTIRPEYANSVNADIFISIHTNAGGGGARGTMTLWGGLDAGTGGGSPAKDRDLADDIHPPLVTECGTQDRGVWKDQDMSGISLCVLRETNMPACLVEVAFHDNYDDNLLLHEEWFKEDAGRGMLFGIFDHYQVPRPNTELPNVQHELTAVTDTVHEDLNPHLDELENGHLVMVWERNMGNEAQIMLSLTRDRGSNWTDGVLLASYENEFVTSPSFSETKDGSWFVAYERGQPGSKRIFYRRSLDRGVSWSDERELTDALSGNELTSPGVHLTEYGTLWCCFSSEGNERGVYFCHSTDNGGSFNSPALISDGTSIVRDVYNTQTSDNRLRAVWSQFVEGEERWSIYSSSSFSWDGWGEPIRLTGGSDHDGEDPALGERNGEILLFYTSDRTEDDIDNGDIFFMRSADGGQSWSEEELFTPHIDEDASPAAVECSDGRLWVVFSSQNGTGGKGNIYLTNNVTDAGNRQPVAVLKTENGRCFETLYPTLEFNFLDHDGDECAGAIFWRESGSPENASSRSLISEYNFTFEAPLGDATRYDWWIEISDGESTGRSEPRNSSFYVDINHPPRVKIYEPGNGTVFPWDVENIQFMFRTSDADHDDLELEVLLSGGPDLIPGDWNVIYHSVEAPGTVYVPVPEDLEAGTYRWFVTVMDENGTANTSAEFSFSVSEAPDNLPPVADPLSDHSITMGEKFELSPENCADPEGGKLHFSWWLFDVDGIYDPCNMSFEDLSKYSLGNLFSSRSVNLTFERTGTYLLQLNITDSGAYGRPQATIFLRSQVLVKKGICEDPVRGGISAPDIVGARVMVRCRSSLTWVNDTPTNYTWLVTLEETTLVFHTRDLVFDFPKAGDYNLTLMVLTGNGSRYLFSRELTAIPREAWDAAWVLSIIPGAEIELGEKCLLSLKVPTFFPDVPDAEWYYGSEEGGDALIFGNHGLEWNFEPIRAERVRIKVVIGSKGMEYSKEVILTVRERDINGTDDDEGIDGSRSTGSTAVNPYVISFIIIFILAATVWLYLIKSHKKKDMEVSPGSENGEKEKISTDKS